VRTSVQRTLLFVVPLLLVATVLPYASLLAKSSAHVLPERALEPSRNLGQWVNSLRDRSASQIAEELGTATERRSWKFHGKKELLLHYEFAGPPKATVQVYFLGDRAIKASIQLLSD